MTYPLPQTAGPIAEQPIEFIEEVCGIYFRSVLLEQAGTVIPQHAHDHDHATYVGSGAARVWVDGQWFADVQAGKAIPIKAESEHVFQSLKPMTRLTCVHDAASADRLKEKGA